jgi:hypothetical protein
MGLRGIGSHPLSARGSGATPLEETERGFFTSEAVELFLEIERTPGGYRPHTDDSRRLAGLLGLVPQWLKGAHVNDPSRSSGYPPGHLTDVAFWKVRKVRKALLAAASVPADPAA